MVVHIDKFWIEGILIDRYPQFLKGKGADLDGNGVIEGNKRKEKTGVRCQYDI
jgi:hypothetical protein